MAKANLKPVKKKEDRELEDEELQEIIKEHGLNHISTMVCGELQSMGDFLSRDRGTNDRINILNLACLEKLSLARTTIRFAQENEGKFEEYEIDGIELAVNECYAMLEAAISLGCRRPFNQDK